MRWFNDLFNLIFPRICASCGASLWKHEEVICHFCEFHLPKTGFHLEGDNPVAQIFLGRTVLFSAAAFLYFNKGNHVQRLMHQLKYKGRRDIGVFLGKLYAPSLAVSPWFSSVQIIVPVPLHKKKYMKRGYNQSDEFAKGLAAGTNLPVHRHLLIRTKATETQTRKSRFSRYQNVQEIFKVAEPEKWTGMHILLVDDVVTTGATLEACSAALREIPGVKISVACIAAAMR